MDNKAYAKGTIFNGLLGQTSDQKGEDMGFTFEEFPNSDYYDSDLREILMYVRKISAYLKSLDAIIEELREGLARLDQIEADVDKLLAEYDDILARTKALEDELSSVENHLTSLDLSIEELTHRINLIDIQLGAVYQYVDDTYAVLRAEYKQDFNLLLLKINQIKVNLEVEIEELRERVDSIDTSVYNSWMNRVVTPQENSDFAFNHLADECLTAEEYMSLGYTASDYANLDITSREYQEFGKKKTHFNWVYNPVAGWRQEISNVLTAIVNFVCNTLTATAYASLDLTADEYTALDLTSEQYFRYNPLASSGNIILDPNGTGLTSEQYSHLTVD